MNINGANGPAGAGFGGNTEFTDGSAATVQAGETTLAQIAARMNVPLESLLQANPQIQDLNRLTAGQDIHLPQAPASVALDSPAQPEVPAGPAQPGKVFDRDLGSAVIRARIKGGLSGSPLLAFGSQAGVSYAGTAGATKASAAATSQFTGMRLGTNNDGVDVVVKREIGAPQGYDERLQAIAVARLGGAEPAAVVQSMDGKWHALETTANFAVGPFTPSDSPTLTVYGLPSSSGIADQRRQVATLKDKLQALETAKAQGNPPPQETEDRLREDLAHARVELASLIFGVPESEIQFNRSSFDREPGKINLNPTLSDPGRHGYVGTAQGEDFQPGMPSAFEIRLDQLDKPAEAYGVMFHEVSHLKDYDLAQEWVGKFQRETGHVFVGSQQEVFQKWMMAQAPRRLSQADAELVTDVAADRHATTEARAYSQAFQAALQAGSPEVAANQLLAYSKALKDGRYPAPAPGSQVTAELTQELQTAYRQMPKAMQQQFSAALTAAQQANKGSWLSGIKIP